METLEELITELNKIKKEDIAAVGYVIYYEKEASLEEKLCSLVTNPYLAEQLAKRLTIHAEELQNKEKETI